MKEYENLLKSAFGEQNAAGWDSGLDDGWFDHYREVVEETLNYTDAAEAPQQAENPDLGQGENGWYTEAKQNSDNLFCFVIQLSYPQPYPCGAGFWENGEEHGHIYTS